MSLTVEVCDSIDVFDIENTRVHMIDQDENVLETFIKIDSAHYHMDNKVTFVFNFEGLNVKQLTQVKIVQPCPGKPNYGLRNKLSYLSLFLGGEGGNYLWANTFFVRKYLEWYNIKI